ncbi:MAG: pyruvate kinase [Anaerolineales bacterium]|nr:pyruvate kinase [Anaerolineales bacterium]
MNRNARIIATVGPNSSSAAKIRQLINAGVNVFRLNFSHGTHEDHAQAVQKIRKAASETGQPTAIMMDLQGPKIRTGEMADGQKVILEEGKQVILSTSEVTGTAENFTVRYSELTSDLAPGDLILVDDGKIKLEAVDISSKEVTALVLTGGEVKAHKGVNLPGTKLSIPPLTEKDKDDLAFGIELGVDVIALSFVSQAKNIHILRSAIQELSTSKLEIPIIAKLERPESVENLEEILEAADGVMVARGDLGVEVSPERVPSIQKRIIHTANIRNKVVITATQMLESMITSPTPTRAESSDVANAIFDGSDTLMLSGETAIGEYPIEAVKTMNRIITDAEQHAEEWGWDYRSDQVSTSDDATATTHAARHLAEDRGVCAIAVFTRSGRTALLMSKARPRVPIFAFTPEPETYRRMTLYWGVQPVLIPMADSVEKMSVILEEALLNSRTFKPGDQVVLIASLPIGAMGPANLTLLHTIREGKGTAPWS